MRNRKHPLKPPTDLEKALAAEIRKSVWMVRFYAYRMAIEISIRRVLSTKEQRKIAAVVLKEMGVKRKH